MSITTASRSWSDDQLRKAVADQRSWRGVLRALGLKATSAGMVRTVKQRAMTLGLDTSHMTGHRTWSDRQLAEAVAQATSWVDALQKLGLTDRGESRARVKGHAVRLGLDVAHLQPASSVPASVDVFARAPHLAMLRAAAPSIAVAWFTMRGFAVSIPVEPQVYDLVVMAPDGVHRVQVKTTTSRTTNGTWQVSVGQRPYSKDKSAGRAPYDPQSLDDFFVVDGHGAIYLIPSAVVAGRTGLYLSAYERYRVGNASSLIEGAHSPESFSTTDANVSMARSETM